MGRQKSKKRYDKNDKEVSNKDKEKMLRLGQKQASR